MVVVWLLDNAGGACLRLFCSFLALSLWCGLVVCRWLLFRVFGVALVKRFQKAPGSVCYRPLKACDDERGGSDN